MRSFTEGFPKGSVMISYCWGDKSYIRIPRKVAGYFGCSWLDIQNLIPGVPVAETCREAASKALFRISFISRKYLNSGNCKVEFEEISKEPEKCFIIAYPDITNDEINDLKKKRTQYF